MGAGTMTPSPRGTGTVGERIRWIVEERLGVSHKEFAGRLSVKGPQLSRWINRADYPPSEAYIERIARLGGVSAPWLRYGVGSPGMTGEGIDERSGGSAGSGGEELTPQDLARHFEGMVRQIGEANFPAEELRLRKLGVVEGLTRLYAARGSVPAWVYALKSRIVSGDL